LLRVASNPFHPYLVERIRDGIDHPALLPAKAATAPVAPAGDSAVVSSPKGAATASSRTGPMDDASDLPP